MSTIRATSEPGELVAEPDTKLLFRQYALDCLSLFSYLVGDTASGRAVVVDPQRDVSHYLAEAQSYGLRIERIVLTHLHADFLPGHLELAAATGAAITYGEGAHADFPIETVADGQRISLGEVVLEFRATPGHTPESIAVVVYPRTGAPPWGVLTGDTLFIGDVGRPDLLASAGWTTEQLARRLYRSLHDKLLTLPDATRVFPAHGAGSACGKQLSTATTSTIGEQRVTNYALRPMPEDDFVTAVTEGQGVPPAYFAFAADANRRVHDLLDDHRPPPILDEDELEQYQRDGAVLIDTRSPDAFAAGHLQGSINVPLDGRFAEYAGDVARPQQAIVVITDRTRATEARVRLARIGFDRVQGAVVDIDRVLAARPNLASRATRLGPEQASLALRRSPRPATGPDERQSAVGSDTDPADLQVVDVRNPAEQEQGVIPGARLVPLPVLTGAVARLERDRPTLVYCAGGHRSSIAASVLRSMAFTDVVDLRGGFDAWRNAGLPVASAERPAS